MDLKIICKDCGVEFDFTQGEQKFYAEKGLNNPVRCKSCRDIKNAKYKKDDSKDIFASDMNDYFRNNTINF